MHPSITHNNGSSESVHSLESLASNSRGLDRSAPQLNFSLVGAHKVIRPSEKYRQLLIALSAAALTLLAGCASVNTQEEVERAFDSVELTLPASETNLALEQFDYLSTEYSAWWQAFDDAQLLRLIDAALANSNELDIALANLQAAEANLRGARAAQLPSANFEANAGETSQDFERFKFSDGTSDTIDDGNPLTPDPPNTANDRLNTASFGITTSWAADIAGTLRNASRASRASVQSLEAQLRDVQRNLVVQVARGYFQLQATREQLRVSENSVSLRQENTELIDKLLEQGYASMVDRYRSENQYHDALASLTQLQTQELQLINGLAGLVGLDIVPTSEIVAEKITLITPPDNLSIPDIDILIRHRPDLRALERDLVANAYGVRSSELALYPTLNLTAPISKGSGQLTDTGEFPNLNVIRVGINLNLAAPILGRGRLLAEIDRSKANLAASHARFEQGVRQALVEMDSTLVAFFNNRTITEHRQQSTLAASKAAEFSRKLFNAGELDFTSVIVAEQSRNDAEIAAINAKLEWIDSFVSYMGIVAPRW